MVRIFLRRVGGKWGELGNCRLTSLPTHFRSPDGATFDAAIAKLL